MDVVYPLCKNSRWGDKEIRFSLRSIEKHLKGFRNVYIIGHCPEFLQNVIHIPFTDNPKFVPDYNIMLKTKLACELPEISDPFLFFNDDHYLLTDFQADQFPYFYMRTTQDYILRRGRDGYGYRMLNTQMRLEKEKKHTKNFDVHTPIIYHKQQYLDTCGQLPFDKAKHGFVLKSYYCNSLNIEGESIEYDFKLVNPKTRKIRIFSTFPRVPNNIYRFLLERFPKTSKFEQWDVRAEVPESQKVLATPSRRLLNR